jgi:RNA polymerase sigma-70 factor (ECF subfamily)
MGDDVELLAGICAGQPGAARALYDEFGPAVYSFARRRTGDSELAREIVQDVMLKAWRGAARFDHERGSFRSWVFQIARNATIDAGRRRDARPRLLHRAPEHEPIDASDRIETMFRSWLVRAALDRLPPDHRAVVDLVYFQQFKLAEVAAMLGIAEGTVKSRCFYAMRNLRSSFEEMGVMNDDVSAP